MKRIALINMPFANVSLPSLALTQLKFVLEKSFGDQVSVQLLYFNQEFAKRLGLDIYKFITESADAQNTGLGDWIFRQCAFPDLPDNSEAYFRRYYPFATEQVKALKRLILDKREQLSSILDSLVDEWDLANADLVGSTTMFMQNVASFALAQKVKQLKPEITTVMGGANCETPMGQEIIKNVKAVDFVFSGPALKSFPEFVQYWLNGETEKCHSIKGIFSKKNCQLLQGGPGLVGEELSIDSPIDLNYDQFLQTLKTNFPAGNVEPVLLFETSRGCWWGERAHCTFCGLNGESMGYRAMSPDRALEQFESLFGYGDSVVRYEAVDNILPKSYLTDVLPKVNTPSRSELFYEVKADLSESDVQVLAKARVMRIQPGIESLATSTLKLMKKGTTVFQNLMLLKNCAMYHIFPSWNLLVGFPGEGEDVYKKYVSCLHSLIHLPPPSDAYPVRFDRYSPYFVKAKEYELELYPLDYYNYVYPFDEDSLSRLAYYFADTNMGAKYMMDMARWIGKIKAKVAPWLNRWFDTSRPRPKLFFKENGSETVVYDSRLDEAVERRVSSVGLKMLRLLDRPRRIDEIAKELGEQVSDITREIASLQSADLIFQETDRYLSLVLRNDPDAA